MDIDSKRWTINSLCPCIMHECSPCDGCLPISSSHTLDFIHHSSRDISFVFRPPSSSPIVKIIWIAKISHSFCLQVMTIRLIRIAAPTDLVITVHGEWSCMMHREAEIQDCHVPSIGGDQVNSHVCGPPSRCLNLKLHTWILAWYQTHFGFRLNNYGHTSTRVYPYWFFSFYFLNLCLKDTSSSNIQSNERDKDACGAVKEGNARTNEQ